jgi:hypothetical protein
VDNVRRAVKSMRVDHPVAIDNDYAIWRAFDNHFWPALYFADAQGRIRHHHFGEGEYQRSEMIIQQLLAEAGSGGISHDLVSADARGVEAPADLASLTDLDRQGDGTAAEPGSVIGAYLRDHIPRPRRPGLRHYLRLSQAGRAMSSTPMTNPEQPVSEPGSRCRHSQTVPHRRRGHVREAWLTCSGHHSVVVAATLMLAYVCRDGSASRCCGPASQG